MPVRVGVCFSRIVLCCVVCGALYCAVVRLCVCVFCASVCVCVNAVVLPPYAMILIRIKLTRRTVCPWSCRGARSSAAAALQDGQSPIWGDAEQPTHGRCHGTTSPRSSGCAARCASKLETTGTVVLLLLLPSGSAVNTPRTPSSKLACLERTCSYCFLEEGP